MPLNEKNLWKHLYYNDNGEFISISHILKGSEDSDFILITNRISYFASVGLIDIYPSNDEFIHLCHEVYNLKEDNKISLIDIKAKITVDGRFLYIRSYLAQDFAEDQKRVTDSVIKTNRFVRFTFVAIVVGAILQLLALLWSIFEKKLL